MVDKTTNNGLDASGVPLTAEVTPDVVPDVDGKVVGFQRVTAGAVDTNKQISLAQTLKAEIGDIADISPFDLSGPELKGREVFEIRVKDMAKWKSPENMRKLVPAFGETVFYGYKDAKDPTVYDEKDDVFMEKFFKSDMTGTDLSVSNRIVAVAEGWKVNGFLSLTDVIVPGFDGMNVGNVNLTAIHPKNRGSGLARKFQEICVEHSGYDVILGLSHTPEALKLAIPENNKDWEMYYTGAKNGDSSIPLTEPEQRLVDAVGTAMRKKYAGYKLIGKFQNGLPLHYVSFGDLGMAPRRADEVDVKKGGPATQKLLEMIDWQQKNRPDECIYGIVFLAKKSLLQKFS